MNQKLSLRTTTTNCYGIITSRLATKLLLIVINKQEQTCQVIDIAVPEDPAVKAKEEEKLKKYQDLARDIQKMWTIRTQVLPVVIGALGTVPKRLESNLKRIGTNTSIELIQKTALLGTARILRKVLER